MGVGVGGGGIPSDYLVSTNYSFGCFVVWVLVVVGL